MTPVGRRGATAVAAILALLLAGTAEAKKKKPAKHKTHSGKSSGKSSGGKASETVEADEGASGEAEAETKEETKAPAKSGGFDEPSSRSSSGTRASEEGGEGGTASVSKKRAPSEPAGDEGFVPPALELLVGGDALFRNVTWNQDQSNTLAPYSLAPGPVVRVGFEVYPAAFAMDGFVANVGVFGGFDYGVALTSKTSSGSKTTKAQSLLVGLKMRFPLGMYVPYASVAYGNQAFSIEGQTTINVPAVNYEFVRPGVGMRIRFTPVVDLDVGAGFVYVTDPGKGTGEIASGPILPHTTAYAVDAGLSLGLRLASALGVRAGVDFRQYGLTANSQPTDTVRAGGAADRYITAWGGLQVIFDGVSGGGASSGDEAGPAPAKRRRAAEPDLSNDATE